LRFPADSPISVRRRRAGKNSPSSGRKLQFYAAMTSRKNVVAFKIRHQGILIIDKDLAHCVAEEIHKTSLPFETAQDQELCRSYIRRGMRKKWGELNYGTPPPLFSEVNTLSYVWDKPPSTGHISVDALRQSWDITEPTPMYVLQHATDLEKVQSRLVESLAEMERLTTAHTLHAEKYSAMELLQQGYHQVMATTARYSRGL
jgi:hypothetical protein